VLKVWVDGHGRRPGTYFQGWMPSSHFLGQCVHCGQLILRKISKIDVRLRLKRTKFDFRYGFAPDPVVGAYSALPDPLAVFKWPTSKGRERGREEKEEGKGRVGERKGGEGCPPIGESGSGSGREDGRGEGQGGEIELGCPGTSFSTLSTG